MGGACNRVPEIEYTAKYYFNDFDAQNELRNEIAPININVNNIEMEERVSLTIELKNVDTSNEHRVELIRKTGQGGLYNESVGFTERKTRDMNNTIIFQQFFTIPYYFEKQQLLDFKVYYNSNLQPEIISTSLGSIMGGRGQTFKKNLSIGETLFVKGKEHKKSSKKMVFNIELNGNNFTGMKFRYTITDKGTEQNQSNKKIYDSEVKGINKNSYEKNRIIFDRCNIPVMYLNRTKFG